MAKKISVVGDSLYGKDGGSIYERGTRTHNTPYHHSASGELTTILVNPVGVDTRTGQPNPTSGYRGGLLTASSGFCPDQNTLIYYVRDSDLTTFPNNFVSGSQGKAKKMVVFEIGAQAGYLAQVTIISYQNISFPTKPTTIYNYEEDVSFYLNLSGGVAYDPLSAIQNNINPN